MGVIYSDAFTRTDAATLGPDWSQDTSEPNTFGFEISANRAIVADLTADGGSVLTAASPPSPDYYVRVIFSDTAHDGLGSGYGFYLRGTQNVKTGYRVVANADGCEFLYFNAGSVAGTLYSSAATTFSLGDELWGQFSGTTWTLKKNGTPFATNSDSNISAAGIVKVAFSSTNSIPGGLTFFELGTVSVVSNPVLITPRRQMFVDERMDFL